jgi:DNA-binding response OmpR family regulator
MSKILIIEDNPLSRLSLKGHLIKEGYIVIESNDGRAGLILARSEHPDLILLDVMLPQMDGYHVARLLKFDERYKNIPIIMLTARTNGIDRSSGIESGVNCYITKPFDVDELLKEIERLLGEIIRI